MAALGRTALGLLATLRVVSCLQSFELEPKRTEVNPGEAAVLHCKIHSKAGQCSWQKDGYPIGPEQDKYEWVGAPDDGDCSLRVLRADLKYDDGLWSCQVTASSFQTQDALRSTPAPLVVRVEPKTPQIEFGAVPIPSGRNLTARLSDEVTVQCSAAGGNPPAIIRWFVGEEDLTQMSSQRNVTDVESPKTFTAISELRYSFRRQHAGAYLRCVALHQAYDTPSRDTIALLDLQYVPEVRLTGLPDRELEENVDVVVLECQVDANPAATVLWRFAARDDDRADIFFVDKLELRPVTKKNSGTYECEASNGVGTSKPLRVTLDIKYAPRVYHVQPLYHMTAALYNASELECEAEGSPEPSYQWLQRLPAGAGRRAAAAVVRGTGRRLRLQNVTYQSQGQYVCVASNVINGEERSDRGEPVELGVIGPPQIVRAGQAATVSVVRGQEAVLEQVFCSDPLPSSAVWHWDGQQLQTGSSRGRYSADDISQEDAEDCYRTRLRVQEAGPADQHPYFLHVQNDLGSDRHGVALQVEEPVSRITLIAGACGGLLLLVVVVALLVNAFRKDKWCFSHKGGFKPTDIDSEKREANGRGECPGRHGLGAIPPDALYTGPKKSPAGITGDYEYCGKDDEVREADGSWGGIIYADLQLPRASNNGSMRKYRHHVRRGQSHLVSAPPTDVKPTEYAEIAFSPRTEV
ncbi:irregular chiasm C-roughest protein-like isoform X2 [Pollicipes pollicipes]|uniref:irregular chiasm C-roughest protein-like isoform X2 n=1 Tax=Pollicipes pollicipes TaxID=41117 RepID=UPI0018852D1F|nr:irregular chiasm C-roughest protein-like isoform X2 [Pollicipes pollicipes]